MISFDTTSSFSVYWTVSTSPTVASWSHNNTGTFLVVFFEEFTGTSITAKSATFNWVAMTALGNNGFYLSSPAIWNYTLSVSLTHADIWVGTGIAYTAASYKLASIIWQPKNYTDTGNNWTNTVSSAVALSSFWAWHIWCWFEYQNATGMTWVTSLRNSVNIPNTNAYIGIIDSNGEGTYPWNVTLTSTNSSTLNQWSRLASFMLDMLIPLSPWFIML